MLNDVLDMFQLDVGKLELFPIFVLKPKFNCLISDPQNSHQMRLLSITKNNMEEK